MLCPFCAQRHVTQAFQCRAGIHVGCCDACLGQLDRCPWCRDPLRPIRVYLYPIDGDDATAERDPSPIPPPPPPPTPPVPAATRSPPVHFDQTVSVVGVTVANLRPHYDPEQPMLAVTVRVPRVLHTRLRASGITIDDDKLMTVLCYGDFTDVAPRGARISLGAYVNLEILPGHPPVAAHVRIRYPGV